MSVTCCPQMSEALKTPLFLSVVFAVFPPRETPKVELDLHELSLLGPYRKLN